MVELSASGISMIDAAWPADSISPIRLIAQARSYYEVTT
jgi:hypothetical protein